MSWVAGAVALALAAGLFLFSPRLGGVALIVIALGALSVAAFRLL